MTRRRRRARPWKTRTTIMRKRRMKTGAWRNARKIAAMTKTTTMKTTMTTTMTRRRRRAKREKDERETSRNPESSKSASNNKLIYTPNQATDQTFYYLLHEVAHFLWWRYKFSISLYCNVCTRVSLPRSPFFASPPLLVLISSSDRHKKEGSNIYDRRSLFSILAFSVCATNYVNLFLLSNKIACMVVQKESSNNR